MTHSAAQDERDPRFGDPGDCFVAYDLTASGGKSGTLKVRDARRFWRTFDLPAKYETTSLALRRARVSSLDYVANKVGLEFYDDGHEPRRVHATVPRAAIREMGINNEVRTIGRKAETHAISWEQMDRMLDSALGRASQ